ncbi:MAG: hypothetical protein WA871_00890 [Candidatus Acidiferrales bacterium]
MADTRSQILGQQRDWAAKRGIEVDGSGYTKTLEANLFKQPHPDTLTDFQSGDGDELGRGERRGKMQALHSSSALVVNVFDYWRVRPLAWLAGAMSLPSEPLSLRFEAQFHTGLRGNPPNLDLALALADGRTIAVESKFTEPYAHANQAEPFKDKYFPIGSDLWRGHGLPRCQALADRLHRSELKFERLNAAQLLKHALGLAQSAVGKFGLFYLWYDFPSGEATQHGNEVKEFTDAIGSELDFRALTYQGLLSLALSDLGTAHGPYKHYIHERYFPTIHA